MRSCRQAGPDCPSTTGDHHYRRNPTRMAPPPHGRSRPPCGAGTTSGRDGLLRGWLRHRASCRLPTPNMSRGCPGMPILTRVVHVGLLGLVRPQLVRAEPPIQDDAQRRPWSPGCTFPHDPEHPGDNLRRPRPRRTRRRPRDVLRLTAGALPMNILPVRSTHRVIVSADRLLRSDTAPYTGLPLPVLPCQRRRSDETDRSTSPPRSTAPNITLIR